MSEGIQRIIAKYRAEGIVKGSEFLLPPETAVCLVDDLEAIGVVILGVDGWRYVDKEKGWIVQDLEVELSVDDMILQGDQPARRSAALARDFIANRLPKKVDFVSLILDIPVSWGQSTGE